MSEAITKCASSWNRNLTRARAAAVGAEFAEKGVNVLLGPVVGPLGRIPVGSRNWEGFSSDPYLAGALAYETVQGVQDQGVIASTKVHRTATDRSKQNSSSFLTLAQHFIGNEQESYRRCIDSDTGAVSSNIDDQPMHELYMWFVRPQTRVQDFSDVAGPSKML